MCRHIMSLILVFEINDVPVPRDVFYSVCSEFPELRLRAMMDVDMFAVHVWLNLIVTFFR